MDSQAALALAGSPRRPWLVGATILVALTLAVPAKAQQANRAGPANSATSRPIQQQPGNAAAPATGTNQAPSTEPAPITIPQYVISPWRKMCGRDGPPGAVGAAEICLVLSEALLETGQFAGGAVLVEPQGDKPKILRVTFPTGVRLPQGTRVIIDHDPPTQQPYVVCLPRSGCMSDYEVDPATVSKLETGKTLTIQAISREGQTIVVELPLEGFAKARKGPAVDPQVLEAQKRKLEEDLQRHAQQEQKQTDPFAPPGGHAGGVEAAPIPAGRR
jgi:invasion protein IalB